MASASPASSKPQPKPLFKPGVVLVAGGTGGFGQAICEAFAREGTPVAFTYRSRAEAARQLQEKLSGFDVPVQHWALDLNDFAQTESVLAEVRAAFGAIHSVVYAAGPRTDMDYVSKLDPARVASIVHDDVVGFFHLARAALPLFKLDGGGSITAVTTTQGNRVEMRGSMSAVPKAAVESLVRAIAREEARNGIRANSVRAGWADVGLGAEALSARLSEKARAAILGAIPMSRLGQPEEIADAVVYLASERASFITGTALTADGGQHL